MSMPLRWSPFGRGARGPLGDARMTRGRAPRRRSLHVESLEGRQMLAVAPATITLGAGVADGATLDEAIQPGGVVRVEAPAGSRVITQFVGASGAVVEKSVASAPAGAFPVTLTPGDVETLRDGLTYASVWVVDVGRNAASNRIQTFTIDTQAPAAPVIALGAGVADGATVAETTQPGGVLRVTGEWAGWTTVQIYGAADPGGAVTRQFWSVAPTAIPVTLSLDDVAQLGRGLKYASVWVQDAAGNATNAFTTFTIDIPEAPLPQVSVVPLESGVAESRGAIDFVVTLSAPSTLPVRVSVATADGTARVADRDYEPIATPRTLRFAPGETMKIVRVNVIDDVRVEDDETFSLVLSDPRWATLATATAIGAIRNDDTTAVSVSPASVVEGDSGTSSLIFTVSLSAPAAGMVYVSYATADGTATVADGDYRPVATPRRLTFLPGETAQTVEIVVNGDLKEEADETLSLVLSSAVNATLGTATATGTIRSDDWRRVSVLPATVSEGDTGSTNARFRVVLSAASALPVSVRYATVDGTATAADWDYLPVTPQVLSFAPGETEKLVDVTVYGDTRAEADETFSLVLSTPVNAVLAETPSATATIRNDDVPSILVSAEPVAEGDTGTTTLVFQLALSMPSTLPVTVMVAAADGTATAADQDYQPLASRQVSFAPGETVKTVAVKVYGDTQPEADETVSLVLWSPVNATVGATATSGTIRNDDFPTVSVSGGSVTEGNAGTSALAFKVSLSGASAAPVTVRYATADGTATAADQDYQPVSPEELLVFAPGETVKTVVVNIFGDTKVENDETFTLVISAAEGATLGTAVATGTIRNDDVAPPTPPPPPAGTGTWTIMVYMTGENLNTFARDDINEMEQFLSTLPANSGVSIIVSWDQPMASVGTAYATGNGSQAAWRTYGRSVLQADTTPAIASVFDLSPGEKNTGDPATLVDFMKWGAAQRPAANYALQLWGHGGGLDGSQFDSESGGIFFADALTIPEVTRAISSPGVPPLKLVSYDNCLMQMAEVGFALSQQFTGHYVASEEVVPGAGQNYVTAYSALVSNPGGKTSADVGAGMVTSYQQQYVGNPLRWDTFSSVATSGYGRLATALSQFVTATESLGATDRTTIRNLVTASPSLSFDETSFRDLGRFMTRVVTATTLPQAVRDAATAVGSAVTAMVAAKTNDARGSSGIAIYLPTSSDSYLSSYTTDAKDFCQATRWDRFARWLATGARDAAAAAGGTQPTGSSQRRTTTTPVARV